MIDLPGRLRRLATAVTAPIVSLAALIASLGNATADMDDVTQVDHGSIAAYLKLFRNDTRGHNQTRVCLVVPDLANLASDDPNTVIRTQLEIISTVSLLDQTAVDADTESWSFYDLIVVGSDTYAAFVNANVDELIPLKVPIMVCNSAVAEHLKMGTATTQSANTVNEWCKTIGNRLMYLIFGSTGDKALFTGATVSDRLDMSDGNLHEHLLMTSLTGDTNTTAVLCDLPLETGDGILNNLNDGTEMPSARMFAGCFVNADNLTDLGTSLLRRTARNVIQAGITPSITLKANASLLSKIYQDTADMQPNVAAIHGVDLPLVKTDTETIIATLGTPANFMADVSALALEATLDTHDTDIKALLATIAGYIDTEITAITPAGPTKTEMDNAHDLLATEAKQDIISTNVDQIEALVATRVAGKPQILVIEENWIGHAASTQALVTAVAQDILIESITFYTHRDLSLDSGFSGISFDTDAVTPASLISQAQGVKANLTEEGQLSAVTALLLKQGTYITYTVYGGAIASVDSLVDIVIIYKALVSGGYLG